jgi:hypothetical protein
VADAPHAADFAHVEEDPFPVTAPGLKGEPMDARLENLASFFLQCLLGSSPVEMFSCIKFGVQIILDVSILGNEWWSSGSVALFLLHSFASPTIKRNNVVSCYGLFVWVRKSLPTMAMGTLHVRDIGV